MMITYLFVIPQSNQLVIPPKKKLRMILKMRMKMKTRMRIKP